MINRFAIGHVRTTLLTMVVACSLLLFPAAHDILSLPKFAALVVGLAALVAAWAGVAFSVKSILLPRSALAIAAGVWLLAILASTLASDQVWVSVFGPYRRWTGLLTKVAMVAILLSAATTFRREDGQRLALGASVVAGVTGVYGLFQWVGLDFVDARTVGSQVTGTFGNSNFQAGALAITLPLVVSTAFAGGRTLAWRASWLTIGALGVLSVFGTKSLQGPLALAAAGVVAALLWLLQNDRRREAIVAGLVAALGGVMVAIGAAGVGPLGAIGREASVLLRRSYWGAAVEVSSAHPWVGVGPGRFQGWYRAVRSPELASSMPEFTDVDSAHNVILDTLVSSGVFAVLGLLAVLVLVSLRVLRVARLEGPDRRLGAAFAASWTAFVVQGLVSPETIGIVVLGMASGGALVAITGRVPVRLGGEDVDLGEDGSQPQHPKQKQQKRKARASRQPEAPDQSWKPVAGVVAIMMVLSSVVLYGDVKAKSSDRRISQGDLGGAIADSGTATRIIPIVWTYHFSRVRALLLAERLDEAELQAQDMLEAEGRSVLALRSAAEVALARGDQDLAVQRFLRAIKLDPWQPELQIAAAIAMRDLGEFELARQAVARALVADPENPSALILRDELASL